MGQDTSNSGDAPPDQGRAGGEQVGRQDQLHRSNQSRGKEERASSPDAEDHGRNANLDHGPPDDDGFADYQARKKDDDTPDTNWDMDDYRRTDFAGSRDGTNHPNNPPGIDGEPPLTPRPD
jgi:hypothetical protein